MFRFLGFDGLRAWLAWAVVVHHATLFVGLQQRFANLQIAAFFGGGAVKLFIILSGFVITHLILEKREPYRQYIVRRFLRLYPIYFVALMLGCITTFLAYSALLGTPAETVFPIQDITGTITERRSLDGLGFFKQLALHLTLLHGAVPDSIVLSAPFLLLAPAWSLSLEWQFYLLAPWIVRLSNLRIPSILLSLAAVALFQLFEHDVFGHFVLPSFLPGATILFAIGIASRMLVTSQYRGGSWLALVIITIGGLWGNHIRPAIPMIWIAFLWISVVSKPPGFIHSIFNALFDSRLAQHLGKASYSTYLMHMPVLQLFEYLAIRQLGSNVVAANLFAFFGTIILTYLVSQLTYRWIEVPSINFGKRFVVAKRPGAKPS